jgi:hypothetical protein
MPDLMTSVRTNSLVCAGFSLLFIFSQICFSENPAQQTRIMERAGCSPTVNFEKEGYVIRSSRLDDPFQYLRWVSNRKQSAARKLSALLDGKPFHYQDVVNKALQTIEDEQFLPDSTDARVAVLLEFVSIENCSAKSLDLVYHVYSTQLPPVLSGTPESHETENEAPQRTAGLADAGGPVQVTPSAGYSASERLFGGGRMEVTAKHAGGFPFHSFLLEGEGSPSMRSISASLLGSSDSKSWLAHATWQLGFLNSSVPSAAGELKQASLSAEFSGTTRSFANGNLIGRFGGLFGAGNLQSNLTGVKLARDTVPSSGYGSLKVFAGLDSRLLHHVLSVSYGLELGSDGPATHVDWRKQIADVTDDFWYPLGNHKNVELESRFTLGAIQVPGNIPVSARFFGGNTETFFIPDDSWKIRANPVFRAIPANRFGINAGGAGGDSFISYNLTAAWTLWRMPLIPSDLAKDAKFRPLLDAQLVTAVSTEQIFYASRDAHFLALLSRIPGVRDSLAALKAVVLHAQTTSSPEAAEAFKICIFAINTADRRAKAAEQTGAGQFGNVSALLSVSEREDENRLAKVMQKCGPDLGGPSKDPPIAAALSQLDNLRVGMERDFGQIDQRSAAARATEDLAFVRRTLNTLFQEVNIFSISPVAVFDIARIGPEQSSFGGWRYGPGAGVRLRLVSTINFTVGYAWNIKQRPGEGPGALFFSMGVRDIFR